MATKKLFENCKVSVTRFLDTDIIITSADNDVFEGEGDQLEVYTPTGEKNQ